MQVVFEHGSDFSIELTKYADFADHLMLSKDETRLLVIAPKTDELFSYTGNYDSSYKVGYNAAANLFC